MLMQILSSIKTSPTEDLEDAADDLLQTLPKATKLIIELRRMKYKMPTWAVIQCFVMLGAAVFSFYVSAGNSLVYVGVLLAAPLFTILGERIEWHKQREKLVTDLLSELVSENNKLRRLLPNDPSRL